MRICVTKEKLAIINLSIYLEPASKFCLDFQYQHRFSTIFMWSWVEYPFLTFWKLNFYRSLHFRSNDFRYKDVRPNYIELIVFGRHKKCWCKDPSVVRGAIFFRAWETWRNFQKTCGFKVDVSNTLGEKQFLNIILIFISLSRYVGLHFIKFTERVCVGRSRFSP